LTVWHHEKKAWPDSLQELVQAGKISENKLRSPLGSKPAYLYIKPPVQELDRPWTAVMAYEPPSNHNNTGTYALFVDGHATWVEINKFNELLPASRGE